MSVKVLIPTALRQYADGKDTVELNGAKVGEVLKNLATEYPGLKSHLFNDNGDLRNFVNVYVNEENIRSLNLNDTNVENGDEVTLVPAVAGGAVARQPEAPAKGKPALDLNTRAVQLNKDEIGRYSRHLILPEVGMEGQKKLKAAKVLLVGTGGLGSPLGMYLAAAGIGKIGLVDFDVVDLSNLQRQVIHGTKDIGVLKVDSAKATINDINPNVDVETYNTGLTSENAMGIIEQYDLVIDGTDNFPTRYLVNDACVLLGKPNVYGSIFRFEGQSSVFWAEHGPCYRCLYPEPPPPGMVPSCAEGGVIGILPGIVGLIQANEGVKLILGEGTPLIGRLLLFNALDMKFRELRLNKDPKCPLCGTNPTITGLIDYTEFCGVPVAAERKEEKPVEEVLADDEITPRQVKQRLDRGDKFVLIDVREPHEYEICNIPGAKLIPLSQFETRIGELDSDADIVLHCKMGGRSARAQDILYANGFTSVKNMVGGITRWSNDVDPSVPKY
jgi:adenylyltransferase/sulfurtransferase